LNELNGGYLKRQRRNERGKLMVKGMNRRKFLKTTAVTGTALLAGDIFNEIALAQELVKTPEGENKISQISTKEVSKMALIIATFDLPPREKMDAFREKGREWVDTVLKMPGIKEFRAYRNIYYTSPHVMLHEDFDSLESCLKFIKSKEYYAHIADIRALGVTNLSVQMWEVAPDYTVPLKPSKG
jgi:quinol monooxygenase YgiN